jgi:hypothetical protein
LQSDATVGGTGSTATRILQVQTNGTSAFPVLRLTNSNATPNIANYIISQVTKDASGDEPAMLFNVQTTGGGNLTHRGYSWDNGTTRLMTLDASGNVGIGATPSNWAFTALQVKNSSIWSSGNDFGINANSYYDSGAGSYKYIGSAAASRMYCDTDGTILFANAASGTAGNNITFSERVRILPSGGITFNGDTASANALDDYEEGTFSPSISYSGGSGNTAVVTQVGRYVKIGKWVTVSINVSWVETTASGNLSITNLPFTSVNVANANFVGQAVALSGINGISGGMAGRISANSSTVQLYYGSTGVYTAVDDTHTVGGGGQFVIFTCAYEV